MVEKATPAPDGGRDKDRVAVHNWSWFMFRGVLALILGVLALLFPVSALIVFALVFAAFAFADGVIALISGIRGARERRERWGALVFSGLVGISIGILYVIWPMLSTISYALVTLALLAVWAVLTGVFQLSAAIRLRKQIKGEWLLGLSGLLAVLLGLAVVAITMVVPGASIISVGWIIGLWALISGFALVFLALRLRSAVKAADS
jgi:uncharacterized membrane protein HdeD (DUF308 family)